MPLWGTGRNGLEKKPNWLTDEEKERCFATSAGWVLRGADGSEEVLVAISGLNRAADATGTGLGAATITGVKFASGAYVAGTTKQVKVSYNERVTVTGVPTIVVTAATAGPITASFVSANAAGTTLTFEFVVPSAPDTLTIGTQSVVLAGGSVIETGVTPTVNAELLISAGVAAEAGSKVATA